MTFSKKHIAVFDGMAQPQRKNSFVGGMEVVSRSQARYLSEFGNDVTFVVSQDSDKDLMWEGFSVAYTNQPAKDPLRRKGISTVDYNKKFFNDVLKILDKIKPDVAIFQRIYPFGAKGRVESLSCPSIFFEHSLPEYLGQNMINFPSISDRIYDNGHILTCVSEYARKRYNEKVKRELVHESCSIQVVKDTPKEIFPHENYGIVISRWCPLKHPGKAFEMFADMDNGMSLRVFTSQLGTKPEYEVKFPKYATMNFPGAVHISIDTKHGDIMESAKRASFHITTCQHESSGIASLEAATYGVPNIAFCSKGNHASEDHIQGGHNFLVNVSEYRGVKRQKEKFWDIVKNIDFSLESRKELSEGTLREFSPKKFAMRHENIINKVCKGYERKTGGLENFLL